MLTRPRSPAVRRGRLTFRAKLAAAFASVCFLVGAAVLVLVALLARHGTMAEASVLKVRLVGPTATASQPAETASPPADSTSQSTETAPPPMDDTSRSATGRTSSSGAGAGADPAMDRMTVEVTKKLQDAALRQMVLWPAVGLVLMAVLSGTTAWWLAGRALRPVREVTGAARRMSGENLHERLRLSGPADELRELADTYDAMLDRLEKSFTGQRRFVANASHELLTPLTVQRTSIEVGLADPLPYGLAEVREELLTANRSAEQLVAALLVLARSDRGLDQVQDTDVSVLLTQTVAELRSLADDNAVDVSTHIEPLTVSGDPALLRQLVSNLLRNAIQYNHPQGYVALHAGADRLTVTNTGPLVDPDRVDALFEPFRRLAPDRTGTDGHGLGLSIVRSIADAHAATVTAEPRAEGGLTIEVRFAREPARPKPGPTPATFGRPVVGRATDR
ncbi:HAMP domain-containing histidine kinase [Streptomyces sp. NBC_01288]|uniref:sensor histidine kinase n=1 Tax=Streptomyces sp. NBC_01288 TaxID=2903814 RepID=UPI002E1196BE|nr:HAMP domain-containing histidine kinase [Streptomyces sp. NBC_01288]